MSHLALIVLRARKQPLRETWSCVCHANAPALFAAVPWLGSAVASVWGLVVLVIGFKRVQGASVVRAIGAALATPVFGVALAVSLRVFVVEAFHIPAGSMMPTLEAGDHIFVNKLIYRFGSPHRGDVIVFRYPEDPDKDFIKRVVAVGGDTVELRRGLLYVNGERVPRSFVRAVDYTDRSDDGVEQRRADEYVETIDGNPFSVYLSHGFVSGGCPPTARYGCDGPATVPPGHFFVLGDNRDFSHDSRFWGFVPIWYVKGKAMFVWWSEGGGKPRPSRIGQRIR